MLGGTALLRAEGETFPGLCAVPEFCAMNSQKTRTGPPPQTATLINFACPGSGHQAEHDAPTLERAETGHDSRPAAWHRKLKELPLVAVAGCLRKIAIRKYPARYLYCSRFS
jgi:hypothetical protein